MIDEAVPPVASRERRYLLRILAPVASLLLAASLLLTPSGTAHAANYSISRYICYDVIPITSSLYFGAGVNFRLAAHPNTTAVLATRYSWGWKRDARGNVTAIPGVVKNQYHVRFLDAAGRVLWTEYNSIPNGGRRTYYVGSNVRTIQVIAKSYPYLGGNWAVWPAVGITLN